MISYFKAVHHSFKINILPNIISNCTILSLYSQWICFDQHLITNFIDELFKSYPLKLAMQGQELQDLVEGRNAWWNIPDSIRGAFRIFNELIQSQVSFLPSFPVYFLLLSSTIVAFFPISRNAVVFLFARIDTLPAKSILAAMDSEKYSTEQPARIYLMH